MKKVVHDEGNSRFVIEVDGNEAGFAEYKNVGEDIREFHHTVVDSEYRGQGLSKPLIMEALESTREAGYTVVPTCSAVAGFIEKNPEFQDLVHDG